MKKLFVIIAVTFAVCISVVLVKNEYARLLLAKSNYGLQVLVSSQEQIDNIFVGSSMFRQGIDIGVIEKNIQGNSWVLAYHGNQHFSGYYELKYLLEKGVRIKNVVFDMYAYSAAETPAVSDERLFLHSDLQFKIDLWNELKNTHGISAFWQMFVTSNNETLLTWFMSEPLINSRYHKGGNTVEKPGITMEQMEASFVPWAECECVHGSQADYFAKLVELCKQYGIKLIMAETPKYIWIENDKVYKQIMKNYVELVRSHKIEPYVVSATANVLQEFGIVFDEEHIVDFDCENLDYFQERIHLSSPGRIEYTAKLLQKIAPELK